MVELIDAYNEFFEMYRKDKDATPFLMAEYYPTLLTGQIDLMERVGVVSEELAKELREQVRREIGCE